MKEVLVEKKEMTAVGGGRWRAAERGRMRAGHVGGERLLVVSGCILGRQGSGVLS